MRWQSWRLTPAWLLSAAKPKKSMMQSLSEDVLKNPYVWLFSISYFFVYVVRQGVTSWFVFYLSVSPSCPSALSSARRYNCRRVALHPCIHKLHALHKYPNQMYGQSVFCSL